MTTGRSPGVECLFYDFRLNEKKIFIVICFLPPPFAGMLNRHYDSLPTIANSIFVYAIFLDGRISNNINALTSKKLSYSTTQVEELAFNNASSCLNCGV